MSTEMKNLTEPLLDEANLTGRFKVGPKTLARICHTDSTHKDANGEVPSTQLILRTHGGYSGLAEKIQTSLETGIRNDKQEIKERTSHFGANSFPPPKIKSIWELVMENFDDPINCILLAAAIVSIIIGLIKDGFPRGLIDGTSIIIALMIIIVVNSVNNYISELRLAKLLDDSNVMEVAVYRGKSDETITIDSRELVVGDLI